MCKYALFCTALVPSLRGNICPVLFVICNWGRGRFLCEKIIYTDIPPSRPSTNPPAHSIRGKLIHRRHLETFPKRWSVFFDTIPPPFLSCPRYSREEEFPPSPSLFDMSQAERNQGRGPMDISHSDSTPQPEPVEIPGYHTVSDAFRVSAESADKYKGDDAQSHL